MANKIRLPLQPLIYDSAGTVRFQRNAVVQFLLDAAGRGDRVDMNTLATITFPKEDRQQFAQLIGYSLNGYGELNYVTDKAWDRANAQPIHGKKPKARKAR